MHYCASLDRLNKSIGMKKSCSVMFLRNGSLWRGTWGTCGEPVHDGTTLCTQTTPLYWACEWGESQNWMSYLIHVTYKMQNFSLIFRFYQFPPWSFSGDIIMMLYTCALRMFLVFWENPNVNILLGLQIYSKSARQPSWFISKSNWFTWSWRCLFCPPLVRSERLTKSEC